MDSYVWRLVFLRVGVKKFLLLGVSFLTIGGLIFLHLGVSFLTFGGLGIFTFGG